MLQYYYAQYHPICARNIKVYSPVHNQPSGLMTVLLEYIDLLVSMTGA